MFVDCSDIIFVDFNSDAVVSEDIVDFSVVLLKGFESDVVNGSFVDDCIVMRVDSEVVVVIEFFVVRKAVALGVVVIKIVDGLVLLEVVFTLVDNASVDLPIVAVVIGTVGLTVVEERKIISINFFISNGYLSFPMTFSKAHLLAHPPNCNMINCPAHTWISIPDMNSSVGLLALLRVKNLVAYFGSLIQFPPFAESIFQRSVSPICVQLDAVLYIIVIL